MTTLPRITPGTNAGRPPAAGRRSGDQPTQVIPVAAPANASPTGTVQPDAPAAGQRAAAGHLHRQVWNGRGWVLDDDDRVFHPARAGRPATAPADDTAVFRPPDPPPWADHGRPETRTTSWPHTVDDPRRTR